MCCIYAPIEREETAGTHSAHNQLKNDKRNTCGRCYLLMKVWVAGEQRVEARQNNTRTLVESDASQQARNVQFICTPLWQNGHAYWLNLRGVVVDFLLYCKRAFLDKAISPVVLGHTLRHTHTHAPELMPLPLPSPSPCSGAMHNLRPALRNDSP